MDSVRFGRALGFGARSAAKALAVAVDAATAPNPAKPPTASTPAPRTPPPSPPPATAEARPSTTAATAIRSAAKTGAHAANKVRETRKGIARGSKRFGESVWGPFARLSTVLWLEVTGSFFALFALFAASAVWTHRSEFRPSLHFTPSNHDTRLHLLVFFAMALIFGYFSVSSFIRAYRR